MQKGVSRNAECGSRYTNTGKTRKKLKVAKSAREKGAEKGLGKGTLQSVRNSPGRSTHPCGRISRLLVSISVLSALQAVDLVIASAGFVVPSIHL